MVILRDIGFNCCDILTIILLTWRIWRDPNNASKRQMGFNSAFKGLNEFLRYVHIVFYSEHVLYYITYDLHAWCCGKKKGINLA